jgi:hypothetical protein
MSGGRPRPPKGAALRRFALYALLGAMPTGLLGSACMGHLEDYEAVGINEQQFPVEPNDSAQCVSAAKRATRFCIGRKSMMDMDSHADCNDARWDYHRYCR